MKGITTIAALPGSGSGIASALKAETVPKGREEIPRAPPCAFGHQEALGGYVIPIVGWAINQMENQPSVILYPVGSPTPWDATHESCHYAGSDGRMYQSMGLAKPDADFLDITKDGSL